MKGFEMTQSFYWMTRRTISGDFEITFEILENTWINSLEFLRLNCFSRAVFYS